MAYFLTADGGTESLRARVYDVNGTCLGSQAVPYETKFASGARAEQNPEDWWDCFVKACRGAVASAGVGAGDIEAVSFATTCCTVVALDEHARPLRPAIIWMDVRANAEAEAVLATGDPALIVNGAGKGPVSAEWMVPKALWIARNEPAVFEKAHTVCEYQDFLTLRLTGERAASLNNVGLRWHHSTDRGGWATSLVDALGLSGVVLNGWSLGGAVGVGAAAALGDRCAGVVLTCGASPRYTRTQGFPHGGTAEEVVQTVAAMTADRISFFHGLSRAVCARPVGQPVEDWLWSLFTGTAPAADQGLLDLADLDQREMIARLPVPLLSMVGTEDSFTPPDIGIAASELAADGRLVRFQGCGHAPFIEAFDDYAAALVDFLESLD